MKKKKKDLLKKRGKKKVKYTYHHEIFSFELKIIHRYIAVKDNKIQYEAISQTETEILFQLCDTWIPVSAILLFNHFNFIMQDDTSTSQNRLVTSKL